MRYRAIITAGLLGLNGDLGLVGFESRTQMLFDLMGCALVLLQELLFFICHLDQFLANLQFACVFTQLLCVNLENLVFYLRHHLNVPGII